MQQPPPFDGLVCPQGGDRVHLWDLLRDLCPRQGAALLLRAGFRACYARSIEAAEDTPDASTFSLRLVVMPNGSVRSVTAVGASGLERSAVDCMIRRAQMATFPASRGDRIEVVLPLTLHP